MACISLPVALVAGSALAAGGTAAASAMAPGAPGQPNYNKATTQALQAQIALAPLQYSSEANPNYGQPAYAALQLQNLNTLLNGTPGGPQNVTGTQVANRTGWYDPTGKFLSPGVKVSGGGGFGFGGVFGHMLNTASAGVGDIVQGVGEATQGSGGGSYTRGTPPSANAIWVKNGKTFQTTNTVNAAPQEGLLAQGARANNFQRSADIADVKNLGPQAFDAMLNANPYNAALLGKLNAQANTELDAGSGLTPDEMRAAQQAARSAAAARGMAGGNGPLTDEILRQFNMGQTLLRQRQQFAQGLIGTNQAVIGDPFMQILGRSSGAVAQATQNQAQSGPAIFNPQASLGLTSSNYATQAQLAAASNPLSQLGGVLGGVGGLVGGISSAYKR